MSSKHRNAKENSTFIVPDKKGELYRKKSQHQLAEDSSSSEDVSPRLSKRVTHSNRKASQSDSSDEEQVRSTRKGKKVQGSDSDDEVPKLPTRKEKPASKPRKVVKKSEASKKVGKRPSSPKKNKKKHVDSDSELSSDDEDILATPDKLRAARAEMLTEEEMKKKTREELEKKYRQYNTFVKWYKKEYLKDRDANDAPWLRASKLLTKSAATLIKFKGLENASIAEDSHLRKAIPKLKESGEKQYNEAMAIVETLSEEDKEQFWNEQRRNRTASSFDQLITKKEFEKRELVAKARADLQKEQEDAEQGMNE